jgi:hypothetical protein
VRNDLIFLQDEIAFCVGGLEGGVGVMLRNGLREWQTALPG